MQEDYMDGSALVLMQDPPAVSDGVVGTPPVIVRADHVAWADKQEEEGEGEEEEEEEEGVAAGEYRGLLCTADEERGGGSSAIVVATQRSPPEPLVLSLTRTTVEVTADDDMDVVTLSSSLAFPPVPLDEPIGHTYEPDPVVWWPDGWRWCGAACRRGPCWRSARDRQRRLAVRREDAEEDAEEDEENAVRPVRQRADPEDDEDEALRVDPVHLACRFTFWSAVLSVLTVATTLPLFYPTSAQKLLHHYSHLHFYRHPLAAMSPTMVLAVSGWVQSLLLFWPLLSNPRGSLWQWIAVRFVNPVRWSVETVGAVGRWTALYVVFLDLDLMLFVYTLTGWALHAFAKSRFEAQCGRLQVPTVTSAAQLNACVDRMVQSEAATVRLPPEALAAVKASLRPYLYLREPLPLGWYAAAWGSWLMLWGPTLLAVYLASDRPIDATTAYLLFVTLYLEVCALCAAYVRQHWYQSGKCTAHQRYEWTIMTDVACLWIAVLVQGYASFYTALYVMA